MSANIRIRTGTHTTLRELKATTGMSMQAILAEAVDLYRRQEMLTRLNNAYAALQADPAAWADWQAERNEWDYWASSSKSA